MARLLAEAGFVIITGDGPGIMEAGNREVEIRSIGLNIELPFDQGVNAVRRNRGRVSLLRRPRRVGLAA